MAMIIYCVLPLWFKWVYSSFSPLPFTFLTQLCVRPPQTTILPFCISFSWGRSWSLPPVQLSRNFVHSSSGTLSDLISWIYLSLPLYNCKGIWFRSHLNGLMVSPTFFNLSLNFALRSSWSEPQSAPSLVFADCIELLHLWLLACYRTQGCKESDLPEWRNWLTILIVRFRIILRGSYSKDHSYFRNSKARFN